MLSPAEASQAWAQGFGSSGTKWAAGVNGVTVSPGVLAARQKNLAVQNYTQAADRMAAKLASMTLQEWQQQTISKGQSRLASGAQAGQSKYEQAAVKWFPIIESAVRALPARGDIEANINRSAQFARAMNKAKTG